MVLITDSCTCHEPSPIVLQALCLSDLIPWIYLSLLLHNHKGFDLGHTWMFFVFPYFLQYKSEFFNKEFMICTTDSSPSCFCWLCRQNISPSLAANNIINLTWYWPSGYVHVWVFSCMIGIYISEKEKDFFDEKYIFINTFLKNQNLILIDIKAICLDPSSPRVLCLKLIMPLFPKYPILSI